MPFGLHSDVPDRALPDALRTLLVQQTTALEVLLHYAHGTIDNMRAHQELSPHEKTMQGDALAREVSERLIAREDQHIQIQTRMEAFQQVLKQQGNPILGYTGERVRDVHTGNFMRAKQQLDTMIL